MKAGISTASLFLRENTEDALSLLEEHGVACTEVFFTSYSEYEPQFAELLCAKKGKIDVHSVHTLTTQFEPQLYAEQARVKADAFALLDKVLLSAQMLGAKYYTFHGVARIKRTYREDLARSAERTEEIFRRCAERGVTLCYENVEWSLYNRPGVFRALKERCPELLGVLDIKQARISGYDYRAYLEEMGNAIAHVHVSDCDGAGKMCLPGRGEFDFDELFARLKDVGFQGAVLIENYRKDYETYDDLFGAYEFLAEKAEKFGG